MELNEIISQGGKDLNKSSARKDIVAFEQAIKDIEGSFTGDSINCPLKHSFSDGIYVREIHIPKGMFVVGKIHKHEHPNFLLSGTVDVVTENGGETIVGPCAMISKAGTKRALYATTDLVWITVHSNPTNTQDLEELEKIVIAENYDEYEKFISKKSNWIEKTKYKLIKFLSK